LRCGVDTRPRESILAGPTAASAGLHVAPRQMTGLSGTLEPVKPVLDTMITVEPKERTAFELIEEIFKKISIVGKLLKKLNFSSRESRAPAKRP